ncbi:MAG: hypothetical protein V1735_03840 [Nanoarchaeota archaeon]
MRFSLASVIALFLCAAMASAATLEGQTFAFTLEPLNDVIVSINSSPQQVIVAKEHSYRFSLSPGDYRITAHYLQDGQLSAADDELLQVSDDGGYILDLILFPVLPGENATTTPDPNDFAFGPKPVPVTLIFIIVVLALSVIALSIALIRSKGIIQRSVPVPGEDTKAAVLHHLRSQHGRCTQRDLREVIPLSEAKISLIVSELEHEGKIKKIKRGRGNLLVLR